MFTLGAIQRACLAVLLVAAAVTFAGNLYAQHTVLAPSHAVPVKSPNQPLRFVLIAPQYEDGFWLQVEQGARDAARTLNTEIELVGPRQASVSDQLSLLDMAIAGEADGILTAGVSDPAYAEAIAKAIDRGIPVITIEHDVPGRRLSFVGSDNYEGGYLSGERLVQATHGRADVGIVASSSGPVADDDRVKGFLDAVANAPGIHVVAITSSERNRVVAAQQALQILVAHPEVTALYGTTAPDVAGIAQSVAALNHQGRMLVLGWDYAGEEPGPPAGRVVENVVQEQPVEMGAQAVQLLEAFLRRDHRPEQHVTLPTTLLTRVAP